MIRHWCDIIGDANPIYTDESAAAASAFGHIVAPPAMLDVSDKPGLHQKRDPDNPQSAALDLLDAHGFTSTVAVNSELEFARAGSSPASGCTAPSRWRTSARRSTRASGSGTS